MKVKTKPNIKTVDALQYNGGNRSAILKFVRPDTPEEVLEYVDQLPARLSFMWTFNEDINGRPVFTDAHFGASGGSVSEGDWVIKDEDGKCSALHNEEFEAIYDKPAPKWPDVG